MTTLGLFVWIAIGLAAQIGIVLGVGAWRHWQNYLRLQRQVMERPIEPGITAGKAEAWAGFKAFKIVRRAFEDAAESICSFYLAAEDGLPLPAFLPGQYLTFRLDVPTPAGDTQQLVRCYSLSDAPRPDHYRVSIKRIPAPAGTTHPPGRSSNYFHDRVIEGTTLQVRAPAGHFHLDRLDTPVVLIGGGIGITPLLSMLNTCLETQPEREIWLFYSVRNRREVAMRAHLDGLAAAHPQFHLRFCFSDPLPDDQSGRDFHHRGRVGVPLLRMELPLEPYEFYICGPAPMMESLVPALEDWGVPDARIHFEAFGPASIKRRIAASEAATMAPARPVDTPLMVTFARAGKALPWTSAFANLLDFAEANGIAVDSGCRAGSCGTCQTAIRSGEVIYRQAPDYDPEPGTCLPCSCVPGTDVTLEA